MELERIVEDEEGDKKKKNLTLKTEKEKNSNSNEDMTLFVQNFKRLMKHDKQQNFQHKKEKEIRSLFISTRVVKMD